MTRSIEAFKSRLQAIRGELDALQAQQKAISAKTHLVMGPTPAQREASQKIFKQQSFLYAEQDRLGVILGHCTTATPRSQESFMESQIAFAEARKAAGESTPTLEGQVDWLHAEKEALDELGFFSPGYQPKEDEWCQMSKAPGYW